MYVLKEFKKTLTCILHIQFNEIQVAEVDVQHQSIKERFLKQFAEKTIKELILPLKKIYKSKKHRTEPPFF